MHAKRWTLAIAAAGLLTGFGRVDAAGQALDSRAERFRRETDNSALQNVAPFKVFDNLYYVGVGQSALVSSRGFIEQVAQATVRLGHTFRF